MLLRYGQNSSAAPAGAHRRVGPRDYTGRRGPRSRWRFREGDPRCVPLCAPLPHAFSPPGHGEGTLTLVSRVSLSQVYSCSRRTGEEAKFRRASPLDNLKAR